MGNMPVVEVGGRKVRVKRLLSEGGYARVYKAVDEVNKKEYALKMVRIPRGRSGQLANEEVAEMAVVEQSVVRSLPTNHPNIVRFHDAGISKAENEIRYYILSEYCPSNVRKKMSNAADQGNLLPEKEVLLTFRDALMAVLYLHSRDPPIAHRDLKVENLLVGRDGQIKLCDFGSCSTTHRAYYGSKDIQTANEDIRRNTTAAYRSPEQVDLFQGHVVSEKVDIWALGVILFELAFFQTPFEDNKGAVEGGAILKGLGDRKIPQEKHYSSGLVSLIKCCLVVDPERRPTIGQVIKLCEELKNSGSLPEWPGLNSLPRTPPHSSSSPFSPPPWDMMGDLSGSDRGVITGEKDLNRGSNGGGAERDGRGVGTTTSGERDCPSGGGGGGAGSGRGGGGGSNENAHTRSRSPDVCGSSAARHSGESYQYNQRNGLPRSNSRRSGAIAVAQTSNSDTSKNTGTTASPIASANACVSASPRRSQRLNRTNPGSGDWIGRVGDGMRSKWYKLMGGEQRKRLWVLKTTSQNATGPKPKYVGKLVAALWEKELTMGSVFTLLRDRPLAESPVVAMKALVTTMKLLQQGPPEVLAESTTYAPVVEEIGQMWCLNETWTSSPISAGASSGGRARGAGSGGTGTYEVSGESPESGGTAGTVNSSGTGGVGMDLPTMTLDPTLSRLISRLATMIVEKIRFHEHHPEYASYWSPETGNDTDTTPTTYDRPVQERLPEQDANDEPRTLKVISRLLLVQTSIICTMTEAFILLNKGAKDAGPSTRSALLPLMAESYLTYFATTRVLLTVSEKYSSTTSRRGKPRPENLVALSRQYDKDLKVMRELYKRADEVEEVAVMKRTPRLPAVSPLSEGGAKQFRELSRKTSRQSTFGRASSKMEALKTLQDEERTFVDSNRSRQSTGHMFNSDGDVVEEDDGASENDDSDHDGNNLVIGEESFFGASDRQSQGYGAGAGVGGSGGKVIKCIDSDGGRRLIRVSSNGLIVSLSSNSTTPFDDDDYKGGWGGGDGDARIAGAGAGAGAGTAEASTSEGVARSSNDGDNHDGVGTDDGGGPWEDGSDDDTSGGWGPDGEGDGDGGGGKWARPPKDLRLEVSDESEWSSSNYCTSRGPNSCAPSSGQARESTFGVRRRLLDEDGRVSKTWATDGSGSGSIVVGRGGGGGKLSSRGGPGVSSFPTYPSPRPSSAELNASAAVAAAVATAAAAQRRTSSGMEPNGGGAGGRARGGEGGSRRPSLSLSVEDGGRYTASPRKPPEQMAGGVAWGRSGRKGGGGGGRRDEVHPAEQTASSSMTLRSDMRQDRVGEALMSDFETITLGEGGDGRSMSPSVSTEGMTAAYHIPAAIGRGPSALRRERTHPPPLPPRRDHEGSPTSSAAADGSGEVAYDLSYSNASGASAGVGAPPLPPRLVSATAEPSTVSGGRSAGQNAVRRREGYPGASPARRRGSGSLPQPTQDQEQQNEKHQDGAGSSYSIQSPRLIKGGFGPAMSWTVPAAPSNKGNRRHPITEATAGGRGAGDGVRGGAGAGKSAVVPTTGGNLGGRSSASRGAQAQEPGSGALVAGANARVTGSGKTAQQQQQHHLNQKQQKHGGRHTRAASSGAPTPSNAEAPKSTSRDAVSASPSTKRTRAVSGNLDKVAQGAIGGLRPAAGGGGGGSGAAGDGSACVGGGGGVPVAETGKLAVAKYEYTAQGPEQLSFRVGDIVHVHTEKMNAKGWSLGLANGKVGWFPGDFVEIRSPPPAEKKTRTSGGSGKNAASRSRRQHPNAGAGGPAGGGDTAAQGQGQGRGAAPPPPYPGRNQQQQQQQRPARGAASAAAAGGEQHHQQAGAELYREADDWGTERERARTEGGGGRQPEQLPEHVFAIQMAKNQPWKDRLTPGGKAAYDDLLALFKASRMVLNFEEIDLKSVIGSGAFATVFRGIFRHKVGRPGEGGDKKMEVAVKKLVGGGGGPMEKTLKDFKLECVMLSRLKHRNIIALVGATTDPVTCVMQYCSRGNLMVLLDDRSIDLTWKMKRQMMLDVAMGMKYLHGQNPVIIHRDLKSLNVLIDENWITKVTDFGLSRFKATSVSEKMTGQAGTYHWMAPEVINSQHYTEKADVFSYGIILWEIFTRAIPYGGMQPVQVVAAVLGRRERPRIPSRCPSALSKLMQACWNHEPDQRPSFEDVVPWLESL